MFVFSEKLTFSWPVKVIEPSPVEPGKFVEHEFIGLFETMFPEESEEVLRKRRAIEAKISPDLKDAEIEAIQKELDEHDLAALKRVLKGWSGIVGLDDKPLPFDDDTFRAVYRHRRLRNAFSRAYIDALSEDRARLGN